MMKKIWESCLEKTHRKNVSVNLKPVMSQVKESNHSTGNEFQSLDQLITVRGRKLLTYTFL